MALYKHSIEKKLRHSEEKYFSTVNSISDAVIVTDRNFRVTYLNPSAERITGFDQQEALFKSVFEILVLKDEVTEGFVNPLQCPLVSGRLSAMPDQVFAINRRGKRIPVGESSLSPLINSHNDFSGLVIIFKNLTEKKHYNQLLHELEKQKMAALIEGQERERSRIAKDLHDGLGQMLNAIKMNANAIVKDASSALDLYKLIDEAIQESKRISENLLPSKLQDFDLPTCLKSLCTQIANSAPATKISFEYIGDNLTIGALQKINLYRITQEALTNAIKHAQASSIYVQLIEEDDQIRLTIEDDGNGISFQNQLEFYKQNGLVNMRDRAEMMGGKFAIESDANRGTLLIIEVPIKQYTDVKI
jgi:PAS domain S-box-containing protein